MDSKEFQKIVLQSFTRLEEKQARFEEGQAELKHEIKFIHDDLTSKIEMIATAVKQLVEKMDTLVERMITNDNKRRV